MKITFTSAAVDKLKPMLAAAHKQLKFFHDIEGCGCAVSGVPALIFITTPEPGDQLGTADPLPFYYEPFNKVYYEDHMKVDYNANNGSFSLKSDSQIYTSHLRVVQ